MKEFIDHVNQAVDFYFNTALANYRNVSSFAIVTDESFDTFLIAVNTGHSFCQLKEGVISDEDYWNTAEWTEESLDTLYFNESMEYVNRFLEEYSVEQSMFFNICLNALKKIRHNDICIFLHITDFEFHQGLYNIVKELNGEDMANSYKEYYLGGAV